MAGQSPFWDRRAHADRRPVLIARGRITAALRGWFAARDFVEVETSALQVSPGNETHLHAFATERVSPDGTSARRYLRTSPEFACKKLLSAGEPRIVEFARVFRNRERGALHAPEFTMLEWYRAGTPYEALMEDCAAIIALAADDTWGDIFSRVLVERIEPRLGLGRATVLYEYPAALSALARPKPSDPRVAERFELYVCGVELANGFGELTDPLEQRRRLSAEMAEKERIYGERYPLDEDFLAALAEMPHAAGVALGLDRLVMLATGAPHIDHVMWTPAAEP